MLDSVLRLLWHVFLVYITHTSIRMRTMIFKLYLENCKFVRKGGFVVHSAYNTHRFSRHGFLSEIKNCLFKCFKVVLYYKLMFKAASSLIRFGCQLAASRLISSISFG
jgi:hypothetical protein